MTHPAVQEAREVIALEQAHRDYPDIGRLARAVNLALTLDACISLLNGGEVPLSHIDKAQLRRYKIRRPA